MGEGGRQCSGFLDSHTQTGKKFAKVDRRHPAIADRDEIVPSSCFQLLENVQRVGIRVIKRAENVVYVESRSERTRGLGGLNTAKDDRINLCQ